MLSFKARRSAAGRAARVRAPPQIPREKRHGDAGQKQTAEDPEEPRAIQTGAGKKIIIIKKDPQSPATPMHQAPSEVAGPSLGGTFLLSGSCPPPSSLLPCRACQLRPGAWEASFAGCSRVAAAFPEASVCSLSYFIITSRRGYRSRGERGRERGRQRQRAGGRGKEAGGGKEKFRTQT